MTPLVSPLMAQLSAPVVLQDPPPWFSDAVYAVTAAPLLLAGAVHEAVTVVSPLAAVTVCGTEGGADAGPSMVQLNAALDADTP